MIEFHCNKCGIQVEKDHFEESISDDYEIYTRKKKPDGSLIGAFYIHDEESYCIDCVIEILKEIKEKKEKAKEGIEMKLPKVTYDKGEKKEKCIDLASCDCEGNSDFKAGFMQGVKDVMRNLKREKKNEAEK